MGSLYPPPPSGRVNKGLVRRCRFFFVLCTVSREIDEFRVNAPFFKLLVGTCNIRCGYVFSLREGSYSFVEKNVFLHYNVMIGVGIVT